MPKGVRKGTIQWTHSHMCLSCGRPNGKKPGKTCTELKHDAQYRRILTAERRKSLNLLPGQYERMKNQDNECAICDRSVLENKKEFAVDHNHITGMIRGLLCEWCNHGLGQFRDNPDILRRAIEYLYRSENN